MIVPIRPYSIRGVIYQGEKEMQNAPQAFHYNLQLQQLISHFRNT